MLSHIIRILPIWDNQLIPLFSKAINHRQTNEASGSKYSYYISGETGPATCSLKNWSRKKGTTSRIDFRTDFK